MAFAIVALLLISAQYLNITVQKGVFLFAFMGSLCCYNFVKYGVELDKYRDRNILWMKIIGVLNLLSLVASLYLLFFFQWTSWILLGFLSLLILLYIKPVFPNESNLRSLGFVKVLLVALIWTGITVILPVIESSHPLNWDVLVLSVQRFLIVIALIIPFEIRDIQFDPPEIKTIPKKIGIKRTKFLGIGLTLISFLMVFLKDDLDTNELVSRLWITLLVIYLIARTPNYATKYYAAFWVEAVPIIWLATIYILKNVI